MCVCTHTGTDRYCSNFDLDKVCWTIQWKKPPQVFPQRLVCACTHVFPAGWQEQL